MKKNLRFAQLILSILIMCCVTNFSSAAPISLANFKLGYIKTTPKTLNSSSSVDIGWTPEFDLALFVLRGEISAFGVKRSDNSSFLVSNYEAFAGLKLFPGLRVEAGGGMQNWHGEGGISPVATGGIVFSLGTALDRIYADYSYVFKTNNETKLLKLGIGLSF